MRCTNLQRGHLNFVGEIEGRAAQFRTAVEQLGEQHVSRRTIFHVEIIANEMSVRPDHGPLTAENGANCARHDAVPVQVAAAVEIATAGHGNGQAVGLGIGL